MWPPVIRLAERKGQIIDKWSADWRSFCEFGCKRTLSFARICMCTNSWGYPPHAVELERKIKAIQGNWDVRQRTSV